MQEMTPNERLLKAAKENSVEELLNALENRADLETRDGWPGHEAYKGLTPLLVAAHWGSLEAVKVLLEKGAKIDAVCTEGGGFVGMNLLFLAAWNGDNLNAKAVIQYMAEHHRGALDRQINTTHFGLPPLRATHTNNCKETAELLVTLGADPIFGMGLWEYFKDRPEILGGIIKAQQKIIQERHEQLEFRKLLMLNSGQLQNRPLNPGNLLNRGVMLYNRAVELNNKGEKTLAKMAQLDSIQCLTECIEKNKEQHELSEQTEAKAFYYRFLLRNVLGNVSDDELEKEKYNQGASEDYQHIVKYTEKHPKDCDGWWYLSKCRLNSYTLENKLKLAIEAAEESVRIKEDYGDGYGLLGGFYGQLGKLNEARDYYKKAISFTKKEPSYFYYLALVCEKLEDFEEAYFYMSESVKVLNTYSDNIEQQKRLALKIQNSPPKNKTEEIKTENISQIKIHRGLSYQKIPGDGHCLYSAVSLYLGKDVKELRNEVAKELENKLKENGNSDFISFIKANVPMGSSIEKYIEAVRNGNEWADNLEIFTLMKIFNRPVVIVDSEQNIRNKDQISDFNGDPIFVFYNGFNHYDALLLQEGHDSGQILNELCYDEEIKQFDKPQENQSEIIENNNNFKSQGQSDSLQKQGLFKRPVIFVENVDYKQEFLKSLFELIDKEDFTFNISTRVLNEILIEFKTEEDNLKLKPEEVKNKLRELTEMFDKCLSEIDKNCRTKINLGLRTTTLKVINVNENNREAINNFLQTAFENCKNIEHNKIGCVLN